MWFLLPENKMAEGRNGALPFSAVELEESSCSCDAPEFHTGRSYEKVIWFAVTKLYEHYLTSTSRESVSEFDDELKLLGVHTNNQESSRIVSGKVRQMLGLDEHCFVLQLRNSKGSLIPLNGKLSANTRDTPYNLDVLFIHQRVHPQPRSVVNDCYSATILNQTQIFLSRIANLENTLPELKIKRNEKMNKELHELEDQLNFLQRRFDEADKIEWTGIIKKSPLW